MPKRSRPRASVHPRKKSETASSSTNNNSSLISSEMIEKWNQVIGLRDTLTQVLSFIPEYLLNRVMRLINREFNQAVLMVKKEFKTCVKFDFDPARARLEMNRWAKYTNLKDLTIDFNVDDFEDDGHTIDLHAFSHFGLERLTLRNIKTTLEHSLFGKKIVESLKYLDVRMYYNCFKELFQFSLHTLKIRFALNEDDGTHNELMIEKEELPLFKSLTCLEYSDSPYRNIDAFTSRLVNLVKLNNIDDFMKLHFNLPNLKSYSCIHELDEIKQDFPLLEELKSSSTFSPSDLLKPLSLKTLKSVSLHVDTSLYNLLPDALFELPLLEQCSLLMMCEGETKPAPQTKTKALHHLRKLALIYDSCNGSMPISCLHFNKCENIEKIRVADGMMQMRINLNDFSSFQKLKKLSVTSGSVYNWEKPMTHLESLSIHIESKSTFSLEGLDRLRKIELVSHDMKHLIQYFETPRDQVRHLKIHGKDLSKYDQTFPTCLETLTITNLLSNEDVEALKNLIKRQTNLEKIAVEESRINLVDFLQSLTCLLYQVRKIHVNGGCYPTPYSESNKIGTPIWSREYIHSFGLRNEELHHIKSSTTFEQPTKQSIRDGAEGVVGDFTSLVATKTHHISDMSLSGLLYALKLNGEMCLVQDALNVSSNSSSNEDNGDDNCQVLKSFQFGNCHLSFYENLNDSVFCCAIFDTIMLETSNIETDLMNLGSEDQLNGTQFCNSITKNICDVFCDLFRKDIQNTSVRKTFKAFKHYLNSIYRDVILTIGQQMIHDCSVACCNAKVEWLYMFNTKNCPNIFNPVKEQTIPIRKKNSKSKNTVQNIEMQANTFTKDLSHLQWIIELENEQSQVIISVNEFLSAYVNICKLFQQETPNLTKVRAKRTTLPPPPSTPSSLTMMNGTTTTFQECYILKFNNTFACLPISPSSSCIQNDDHHHTIEETEIQSLVNIHLERIDKFLETIQTEISPQITNVK